MKGPTIWRLPCGSARRTSNQSPRWRGRGPMTSSSASQDLGSPSTGSLVGIQLIEASVIFAVIIAAFICCRPSTETSQSGECRNARCVFRRHPEERALGARLEGWHEAPPSVILRGSLSLAPQDDEEKPMFAPLKPGVTLGRPNGPVIETERLKLRQWCGADVAPNTAMLSDPGTARFIAADGKPVTT